jgi:transcriptional regulator
MYRVPHFEETRPEVLLGAIAAHPLGLVVRNGVDGLAADPLPLHHVAGDGQGSLRAHFARANPLLRDLAQGGEVLVVFQGPQHYVSPSWYATKAETGKVVPTWNFVMVQVAGRARVIDDPVWLRAELEAMTTIREGGRADPWAIGDAPESFIAAQMKGIVGLEIAITAITGKWKVSQNRPIADRFGVLEGLRAEGEAGQPMAVEVERRLPVD